jgi:hypothetical protein
MLTSENIAVGLKIISTYPSDFILGRTAVVVSINWIRERASSFNVNWDDGRTSWSMGWTLPSSSFDIIGNKVYRKPRKVIPDMPLDPELPVLMAGHWQDRQRKKF